MHPVHCFVMEKYCLACGAEMEGNHVAVAVAGRCRWSWIPSSCPGSMKFHVARLLFGILCIMVFGLLTFMALDYHRATDDEFWDCGQHCGLGEREKC